MDATEMTKILHNQVIPKCSELFDEMSAGVTPNNVEELNISEILHREGVNCRHMGMIRSHCKSENMKKVLLTEMIARSAKVHIQEALRQEMRRLKLCEEEPYKELVVREFNKILGRSESSEQFWKEEIKKTIFEKFGKLSLTEEEASSKFDLSENVYSLSLLFNKLLHFVGVVLTSRAASDLKNALSSNNPKSYIFVRIDIEALEARVKHSNLIDYAAR